MYAAQVQSNHHNYGNFWIKLNVTAFVNALGTKRDKYCCFSLLFGQRTTHRRHTTILTQI